MSEMKKASLETLANGAVKELFEAELARVIENVADINTDPQAKRQITINIEIKPEGVKRDTLDVKVKCASKLAGIMTVNTQLFMGMKNGKLIAVENDPRQGGLFDQQQESKPTLASVSNISDKKVN